MNLQQILNNLFSFANSYEAIAFSVILFITLLLGILFTYFLHTSPALKKKRKAISELQSELEISNSKVKLNEEKYTVQVSKTKRLEEETSKLGVQIEELGSKNNKYQSEIGQLQFEKESLQLNLDNCEKEILELKNLYKVSLLENSTAADRFALFTAEKNEALAKLEDYKNLVEQLEKERQNNDGSSESLKKLNAELKSRQESLEKEKAAVKEENTSLKLLLNEKEQLYLETLKQISILKSEQQISDTEEKESTIFETAHFVYNSDDDFESEKNTDINSAEPEPEIISQENDALLSEVAKEKPEAEFDSGSPHLDGELSEIIQLTGQSNELQSDNLKLINGINQETEEKLFSMGINSYEQLSRLNDESINQKLCQLLNLKEKTIENDQWEAQARQLLIKQKINNLTRDINLNKLFKK